MRDSSLSPLHTLSANLPPDQLHNHFTNQISATWWILSLIPATCRYKAQPYTVHTHGVTGLVISTTRWQITSYPLGVFQFHSLEVLGMMPATCWCRVHCCRIKAHKITLFCGWSLNSSGRILPDAIYLHNRLSDSISVSRMLLGLISPFQWYTLRLYRIITQEGTILSGVSLYDNPREIALDGWFL